jgi:hypothetical protein
MEGKNSIFTTIAQGISSKSLENDKIDKYNEDENYCPIRLLKKLLGKRNCTIVGHKKLGQTSQLYKVKNHKI